MLKFRQNGTTNGTTGLATASPSLVCGKIRLRGDNKEADIRKFPIGYLITLVNPLDAGAFTRIE